MRSLPILALLYFLHPSHGSATIVLPGESFVFEFSTLPFVEPSGSQNQGGAAINFGADVLDAGEIARLEFFEDDTSSTPVYTNDFVDPTDHFGATVIIPPLWQDLQGVLRLTMISGSVEIHHIDIRVTAEGSLYFETFEPPFQDVGGTATGLSLRFVVCRNLTTGTAVQIFIPQGQDSWDCEAEGLEVVPGDVILMIEAGVAE